jgi:predicted RND superfamily exporter protein
MFVILGIGADDIFVYSDAWKQSYVEIPDANKQERVAWVFNRASKAMLITSVTTAVAFVANVVSPCAPLRLFGIFMAILVMVDYIFVITMFPAVIVIFHKEHASLFSCCGKDAVCTTDGDVKEHTPRLIESFFRGAFTTFVLKWKWIFIFIGFGVIGAAGWKSTQFPMPTDSIKLFPDSHPLMIAEKANMQLFAPSSDPYVEAYLAWGLIPSDTGNFNEDKARGELKLDDTFDMSQHATQVFLLDFENNMRAKIPNAVRNETFLSNGILKFNTWLLQNRSINHPVDKSCSNGMDLKQDVRTGAAFSTCLMQFLDDESAPYHGFIIDDNQKVRAYMMAFTSTVTKANRMVFDPMRKFYDEVNTYMEQTNNNAGASYNKGYITDYGLLGWNDLLKNFSSSGYISAGLSIGLAYIVLLMTTQNFRVSSFAIVSIYGIIGCVMSILILLGWEMGMLESMCMSILAGVAVDFVIHIGHAYIEGMTENRTENVRNALGALGISVISAGVTTLASALLLFGCTITFFSKFGTFLSLAMVTSLSFAFFLYPPILGVCGPVKGGAMGGHF